MTAIETFFTSAFANTAIIAVILIFLANFF